MKMLLLISGLLLGGCAYQSPPASFFVLSAQAEASPAAYSELLLGVGPVNLADYLDRNQIVRRDTEVRLQLDEFNRWAGDHGKNITAVLAENLARITGSDGVLAHPWASSLDPDYQVVVDISRFDAGQENLIVLDAQWQLFRKPNQLLQIRRSYIEIQASGDSYEAQVKAQSRALAELGKIIAAAVQVAAGND
ncbi:PqiC family protein [Thiolapillus sp.]